MDGSFEKKPYKFDIKKTFTDKTIQQLVFHLFI